jgi:hypothetical protein
VTDRTVQPSRTGENNPPESHCLGKAGFDTATLALKAAKRVRRDGSHRRTYRCTSCGKWHLSSVGHRLKRSKNPRPKRTKGHPNR